MIGSSHRLRLVNCAVALMHTMIARIIWLDVQVYISPWRQAIENYQALDEQFKMARTLSDMTDAIFRASKTRFFRVCVSCCCRTKGIIRPVTKKVSFVAMLFSRRRKGVGRSRKVYGPQRIAGYDGHDIVYGRSQALGRAKQKAKERKVSLPAHTDGLRTRI